MGIFFWAHAFMDCGIRSLPAPQWQRGQAVSHCFSHLVLYVMVELLITGLLSNSYTHFALTLASCISSSGSTDICADASQSLDLIAIESQTVV